MTTTDPNNRISFDMPPDEGQTIEGSMTSLEETLGKHGADLGTENSRRFARAGVGSNVYVKKALVIAQTMPHLCPPGVDPVEFARDVAGADYFDAMERRLNALARRMRDASILCRKEGYQAANAVYDAAKKGATFNLPGAKAAADDLGQQFARRTGRIPASAKVKRADDTAAD